MLDTKTIELSRDLEGKEKVEYGFSLISEFEKLEQEGHIKIIHKDLNNTNIGALAVDTFYEGEKKAKKSRYKPKGYRKGNIFNFALGMNHGGMNFKTKEDGNKHVWIEADIFLKCELWKYTWNIQENKTVNGESNWYVTTKGDNQQKIFMHRLIKSCLYGEQAIVDMYIDHIEHDGLDNRLIKIRRTTPEGNRNNVDKVLGISQHKETEIYYLDEYIYQEQYFNYALFDIKINVERPEPMKDLIKLQQKVIEYYKELDRANKELANNPDYIKYLENERKELESYIEESLQEDTGQATKD